MDRYGLHCCLHTAGSQGPVCSLERLLGASLLGYMYLYMNVYTNVSNPYPPKEMTFSATRSHPSYLSQAMGCPVEFSYPLKAKLL